MKGSFISLLVAAEEPEKPTSSENPKAPSHSSQAKLTSKELTLMLVGGYRSLLVTSEEPRKQSTDQPVNKHPKHPPTHPKQNKYSRS